MNLKEIQFDINAVTGRLSAKIANLELQIAHLEAVNEAYVNRIKELEQKLEDNSETENAE